MAAFDIAMDAAQRRMAELELENHQFREYQSQQDKHFHDMEEHNKELVDEANSWREQATLQQQSQQPPPPNNPPLLLTTPLPLPLLSTTSNFLCLPLSRAFLLKSAYSNYV